MNVICLHLLVTKANNNEDKTAMIITILIDKIYEELLYHASEFSGKSTSVILIQGRFFPFLQIYDDGNTK